MKKILVLTLVLLIISGCNSIQKYEQTMKEYSLHFYENYKKGQEDINNVTVSIKQLKQAVEVVREDYDMSKLKNCSDESYVQIMLNEKKEVIDIKYYLKCK